MGFPLGRQIVAAALVRRERPLSDGATAAVAMGETVSAGQTVATRSGRLGIGKATPILAGLDGRVVGVMPGQGVTIEGVAMVVAGLVGLGGSAVGPLFPMGQGQSLEGGQMPRGAVLVTSSPLSASLLQRASDDGAVAIVAGGMPLAELEGAARTDLTAVLDGLAPAAAALPLALVLTQGLGAWSMDADLFAQLAQHAGEMALADGTTDPRRGIRPEVLIAQPQAVAGGDVSADDALAPGALVQVVGGRWRGQRGEVGQTLASHQRVEAGLLLRCAQVRLVDGSTAAIPLNFLERVR